MALIGDWIRAFKPPDTYRTLANVKNQDVAKLNSGLMSDFSSSGVQTNKALADFTSQYLADQPQARSNADQESAAISKYYSGDFDKMLASIRANRAAAMRTAGDRAIGYADRARKSASMLRPGGASSYFDRLALGQTGDIESKIALDQADQEKQDYLASENARLGLTGRRNAVIDASTGRILVPAQAAATALQQRTGNLQGLSNIDLGNTFYGLQKIKSGTEQAADLADLSTQTVMALASAYFGGAAGGMGGAGAGGMLGGLGGGSGGGSGGNSGGGDSGYFLPGGSQNYAGEGMPAQSNWNPYNWGSSNWLGAAQSLYGGRAAGGPVDAGQPVVVGENGPELIIPNNSGYVVPNDYFPLGTSVGPEEPAPMRGLPSPSVPYVAPTASASAIPVPASVAPVPPEPPGKISKAAILAELMRRIQSSRIASDVGPAPTSTPVGDSFGGVQAAVDRGQQTLAMQANERFRRANLLQEQADQEKEKAQSFSQQVKEWNDRLAESAAASKTQQSQFGQTLAQRQAELDAANNRQSGMDWRNQALDLQREREYRQRQEEAQNAADFNEAYTGVNNGQITDPAQLGNFKHLLPEQIQRLTGYMTATPKLEAQHDQETIGIVGPIVAGIRNDRMKLAKDQLAAEEKKFPWNRNAQVMDHLKQAIATGEGLPLLPETSWKIYMERLAKNPRVSGRVSIDDKTQTVAPVLRSGKSSAMPPAVTSDTQTGTYDFGSIGGQSPAPTGSLYERAMGVSSPSTNEPSPVRRYRWDAATSTLVPVQ